MIFAKGKNYKLTEIGGALVITDVRVKLTDPKQQPLIIADAGPLLTYMDRYFFEREAGKSLRDAHARAMKTAQITNVLPCPGKSEP